MSYVASNRVTFAFIHKPNHHLEWQSILLASSLRYHFNFDVQIEVFLSGTDLPFITRSSSEAFEKLGVSLRILIDAKDSFEPKYPIGNKILLCSAEFNTDRVIFLDSDMFVVQSFPIATLLQSDISVAPAGAKTWGSDHSWNYLYTNYLVGIPQPNRIKLQDGRMSQAYFNAGLISFNTRIGFGNEWLRIARDVDKDVQVIEKRPWLDQITLPLAIHKVLGTCGSLSILPVRYNYNPDSYRNDDALICHYHGVARIYRNQLNKLASEQLRATNVCRDFYSLVTPVLNRLNSGK
jgi:hypothetical protein